MLRLQLNRDCIYGAEDEEETFWRFEFKKIGDIIGWWAFRKEPGKAMLCIGSITEKEIQKFLKKNRHPLEKDDLIDIELAIEKYWGKNLPEEDGELNGTEQDT